MRRFVSILVVVLAVAGVGVRGGVQAPPGGVQPSAEGGATASEEADKKIIDLKSDISGPVAPGDSVIFLVGNFAAQHNGAVITCDSAVRYSDRRIEFFGNVLINKNTTYIYGDRADYDGERNEARVYSDLVKVVDGDATLYTYKFVYNTKTNIGIFAEGGVMTNRESVLESIRGYYLGNERQLAAVERVEMRNEEYELKGDSVVYDMGTDNAFFFDRTNIWSSDGDYLYADRGSYRKADSLYVVTRNGYVLTPEQEMWSDSIDYYRPRGHVILRHNLQIDDVPHKILAFGDYGEYWKEPGNAFLTRRPVVVSYDRSQGDSVFMRADTMRLLTLRHGKPAAADSLAGADTLARSADSLAGTMPRGRRDSARIERPDSLGGRPHRGADSLLRGTGRDSLGLRGAGSRIDTPDSLAVDSLAIDSLAADSLAAPADTLTAAQRKELLREEARREKEARKAAEAAARKERLDRIAAERRERTTARLLREKEREERRLAARRLKAESKLRARQARAARRGKTIPIDSADLQQIDSLLVRNASEQDSLARLLFDDFAADSVAILMPPADTTDSLLLPADSIYRLLKGYRNVKIFRQDFQVVCDSMTAISTDSTIHLYIDPVLWNQSNQITSDVMDIFTVNRQIVRAEFIGDPMMVSELDTLHYNQVAGKTMTAFFRDNEIYRNDVDGNAQTIYYMQDGEPPVITMMGVIESGDISFYIEQKQVVQITYRTSPVYHFYPMDKIPPDQELFLKGFHWEGARRPLQREVFDRAIRPSERRRREALRHPDFPIRARIDEHRKRLVEERRWSDRTDVVDAATVEWMRSLGFEPGAPREESGAEMP